MAGMNPVDLIEGFESDMLDDCHGFNARFERSLYRRELVRRGKSVLQPIIDHLETNPPCDVDLRKTWGHLLNWIEIDIDPEKSGPKKLDDTQGWIDWAKAMVQTST
jgi:hypothetical protein